MIQLCKGVPPYVPSDTTAVPRWNCGYTIGGSARVQERLQAQVLPPGPQDQHIHPDTSANGEQWRRRDQAFLVCTHHRRHQNEGETSFFAPSSSSGYAEEVLKSSCAADVPQWVEMPGGACKACQGNKCTKFSQQEAGAGFLFLGRLLSLSGDDKPSGGGSKSGGASSGGSNSGSSMSNKQCKCGHTYAQHA
ncbi:Hypp1556 [Branchiostoma lanceolatum]|uniref:Hypp1556 protein n=1 Tax=Branchiostoma lanceolatum TaxID=7740 RepID=A0A8J9ZJ23_BRALA|nr:Hypp1556 [Branchiostoma lanceolatum]